MKISGFTFVRNGTILGYPYLESVMSLTQVCDEVIVAVGPSDDDTLSQLQNIKSDKIRIIETTWNEQMSDRGYVYAQQKMIAQFNCTGDWAFYLECDEILHEDDFALIRAQMAKYLANKEVEALVFDYYHFYGSSNYIANSPRWYQRAPRIIRNTIRSWAPDGLFWVVMDENKKGRYPKAQLMNCHIYHYGHVRKVEAMNEKINRVERYWGKAPSNFETYGNIDPQTLIKFKGAHPQSIKNWLDRYTESELHLNPKYVLTARDKKHRVMMIIGKLFGGVDWSKKHYKLIKN
ncbi:MAG: glycosyltransferase [Bacteroidia bacterium]|nr:MAG: glycosyltransferase [Bacteroidia bacterium]